MLASPVKVAVVGCGSIGKRHIAVLDAEQRADLVAICDTDSTALHEQLDKYPYVQGFSEYRAMLAAGGVDVVAVVTPHALHATMSMDALMSGYHVLVEKPMALSSEDCQLMNDCAEKVGKHLWVVKQNRHNVPIRLTKDALDRRLLGRILMVKCDILWNRYQGYYDDSPWRGKLSTEGGALFTQASHFIDLLIWWCGDVVSSKAHIETQNHQIETEDSGIAFLKFASGALGSLVWTTCVYSKNYEGSITIIGEKGTIKIGGKYLNKIEYWDVEGSPLPENIEFSDKPNSYGKYQGTSSNHPQVYTAIIDFLLTGRNSTVDGFEGIKSIQAIEAIYENARHA
jgi:UDP-N-acetyl-2-amino-2-deoxyglucuronate dehydrogenase